MDIYFYQTGSDWDIFSNVAGMLPIEVVIEDTHYSATSTEGIFQGLKYIVPGRPQGIDYAQAKQIIEMQAGGTQQRAGGFHPLWKNASADSKEYSPDPATLYFMNNMPVTYSDGTQLSLKEEIFHQLCRMKATQHKEVMKALLSTGTSQIIENTALASYDDNFWGNGKTGPSRNALGRIWMMLRDEFNQEFLQGYTIPVQIGFTPELCRALGIKPSSVVVDQVKQINHQMVDPNQGPIWNKAQDIQANTPASWPHLKADVDAMLTVQGIQPVAAPAMAAAYDSLKDPNSAHNAILHSLQTKAHGNDIYRIKVDQANNGSGHDVFKLYFNTPAEAQQFATLHKKPSAPLPPIALSGTGTVVIVSKDKIEYITGDQANTARAITEAQMMKSAAIHPQYYAPIATTATTPIAAAVIPAPVLAPTIDHNTQIIQALGQNFIGANITSTIDTINRTLTLTVDPANSGEILGSLVSWNIGYTYANRNIVITEVEATKWLFNALQISSDIFAISPATAGALSIPVAHVAAQMQPVYHQQPLPLYPPLPYSPYDAALQNWQQQASQQALAYQQIQYYAPQPQYQPYPVQYYAQQHQCPQYNVPYVQAQYYTQQPHYAPYGNGHVRF